MKRSSKAWLGIVAVVLVSGCGVDLSGRGEEEVAEAEQASVGHNALSMNALSMNALDPDAIASLENTGQQGELARAFVLYVVRCALTPSQVFEFSWTDANGFGRHEVYEGELGLAPHWEDEPLGAQGERMVSACIASRVNYYLTPILVSIRSPHPSLSAVSTNELEDYPNVEGTFWGNLWGPEPFIHACYNSATVANSRAHQRDCAAGHLLPDNTIAECGIIDIVGPCSDFCESVGAEQGYHPSCHLHPGVDSTPTSDIITTALP